MGAPSRTVAMRLELARRRRAWRALRGRVGGDRGAFAAAHLAHLLAEPEAFGEPPTECWWRDALAGS